MYANEIPDAATECQAIDEPWYALTSIPSRAVAARPSAACRSAPGTAATITSAVAAAVIRDLTPPPEGDPPLR